MALTQICTFFYSNQEFSRQIAMYYCKHFGQNANRPGSSRKRKIEGTPHEVLRHDGLHHWVMPIENIGRSACDVCLCVKFKTLISPCKISYEALRNQIIFHLKKIQYNPMSSNSLVQKFNDPCVLDIFIVIVLPITKKNEKTDKKRFGT